MASQCTQQAQRLDKARETENNAKHSPTPPARGVLPKLAAEKKAALAEYKGCMVDKGEMSAAPPPTAVSNIGREQHQQPAPAQETTWQYLQRGVGAVTGLFTGETKLEAPPPVDQMVRNAVKDSAAYGHPADNKSYIK